MLALIAGTGTLPAYLMRRRPDALLCEMTGAMVEVPDQDKIRFRIERLGEFFAALRAKGVTEVAFAGAVRRPALDPEQFDEKTAVLTPRLGAAIESGDDAALRIVLEIFDEAGFAVRAVQEIAPELLPVAGVPTRVRPGTPDRTDADRAGRVLAALGAADVGQGCAVAQGQVLAVEAAPGTDWMLASLSRLGSARPDPRLGRGVLAKAPKPGQDRRIDLPAIGEATVAGVAKAGLSGLVVEAGGVLVLDAPAVVAAADAAGLFLWVRQGDWARG